MLQAVFAVILCCASCSWTIHGLWPQNGEWCHKTPLNHTAMEPLVPTMKKVWPTCYSFHSLSTGSWSASSLYDAVLLEPFYEDLPFNFGLDWDHEEFNSDWSFWDHEEFNSDWSFWDHEEFNSDWSFWDHEWEKHGSCTGMNQVDYFNYTLNLYQELLPSLPTKCKDEWAKGECKLNVTIH